MAGRRIVLRSAAGIYRDADAHGAPMLMLILTMMVMEEEENKEDMMNFRPQRTKYSSAQLPCTLRPSRQCSPSQVQHHTNTNINTNTNTNSSHKPTGPLLRPRLSVQRWEPVSRRQRVSRRVLLRRSRNRLPALDTQT